MQGHIYLPSHFLRQWLDDVEEEGEERGAGGGKEEGEDYKKTQKTRNTQDIVNRRINTEEKRRELQLRSCGTSHVREQQEAPGQTSLHTHTKNIC